MSSGIVMNGPAPIMFVMFSAVAGSRPKRRGRGVDSSLMGGQYGARPPRASPGHSTTILPCIFGCSEQK